MQDPCYQIVLAGMHLYSRIKLYQFDNSLHEYTQEFNNLYSYWKDDISVNADAYLYIGGLKFGALRANSMTNWYAGKYGSLHTLKNDAAKNSFWRSAAVNIPRNSSSATTQNMGKAPMRMPSYKRPFVSIGQSNHGSHIRFGGNGSKSASGNKSTRGHLKDTKQTLKVL